MNTTTKTDTQLKQTAMQLLNLQEIQQSMQFDCPDWHTMDITIAQVFSTQVPVEQYDDFITYYDDYKQAKIDYRLEREAMAQ